MNKRDLVKRLSAIVAVLVLAVLMIGGVVGLVQAAPMQGATYPQTINTAAITANTTFDAKMWDYPSNTRTSYEIWYSIDQGTTNTMTLYLDVSPDGTIWKTGQATVVSANTADATGFVTGTIYGNYYRIRATVANTNTITPTLQAVFK